MDAHSLCSLLLIEPDPQSQRQLSNLLATTGFQTFIAQNAKEALKILETQSPKIILSEHSLPDMTGEQFARTIKMDAATQDIYIIIMVQQGDVDNIRLLDMGADELISKPIDSENLVARVNVARRLTTQMQKSHIEYSDLYTHMDVLLLQDGGCSPGYDPVVAFLVSELEQLGHRAFITREGFRSLVLGQHTDFNCVAYKKSIYHQLEHIPGVVHVGPLSEARGASFRSERYRAFMERGNQLKAAQTIQDRQVKVLITIGGNGTFMGTRDLATLLPKNIQIFFIPVTIDSDVSNTECIGQHTGVDVGAEKIRCYLADARTHKRIYIIEMMGARGGFHALHSCLGARAHLAVIPGADIDTHRVAEALTHREHAVIVVAEGYKTEERKQESFQGNAAEYFHRELLQTGISINNRIVCEAFSRDIRGARPNNIDILLCQHMAANTAQYIRDGKSHLMPSIFSGRASAVPFEEITTFNHVTHELYKLANRLYY